MKPSDSWLTERNSYGDRAEACIYGLFETGQDGEEGPVRYVGASGTTEKQRLYEHIDDAEGSGQQPKHNWIRDVGRWNVGVRVLEVCSIDDWQDREVYWIDELGGCSQLGGTLLNVAPGGEGALRGSAAAKSMERGLRSYIYQGIEYRSRRLLNVLGLLDSLDIPWASPGGKAAWVMVGGEGAETLAVIGNPAHVAGAQYAVDTARDAGLVVISFTCLIRDAWFTWERWAGGAPGVEHVLVPEWGFHGVSNVDEARASWPGLIATGEAPHKLSAAKYAWLEPGVTG